MRPENSAWRPFRRRVGSVIQSSILFSVLVVGRVNAGEPELWICPSKNLPDPKTLYLVYKESGEHHDFMLFADQGGLLGMGPLDAESDGDRINWITRIRFKSGVRKVMLSSSAKRGTLDLTIFDADGTGESDLFECK